MNANNIQWRIVDKDELPDALFGECKYLTCSSFPHYKMQQGAIALGYMDAFFDKIYNPPCIIVIEDNACSEIFSWLRVSAFETMPLSQFARVILESDWKRFSPYSLTNSYNQRSDSWASIVIGEAVSQVDAEIELSSMPLSWSLSCFSTAISRTSIIYNGDENILDACIDRLSFIESDQRISKRTIMIKDIIPIWKLISAHANLFASVTDAADFVVREYSYLFNNILKADDAVDIHDYRDLLSDSVEKRVSAYYKVVSNLSTSVTMQKHKNLSALILAAAAIYVGRSTSHAFLVRRSIKAWPTALLWFGLIAGLAGPRGWHPDWSRAVKGIERFIRTPLNWTDYVNVDLCWAEYSWLSEVTNKIDIFSTFPKIMSKGILIEIIPGVTCQFKLSFEDKYEQKFTMSRYSAREQSLNTALSQFVELAMHFKPLLTNNSEQYPLDNGIDIDSNITNKKRNKQNKNK
jgi:hypothetical protein